MDYIRFAISNPVKVSVGVALILLFGFLALFAIPVQLTPNVDRPIITVQTNWTGRSPEEIERDIIEEQEEKLKSVSNLKKMIAVANEGQGEITLEFYIGTDINRALQEVSDKLREVPEYPDDVDEPVITAADVAGQNAIAWVVLTSSDPDVDVQALYDQVDDKVRPYLKRIGGLSEVNLYGGREREVHVQVDPQRLAQHRITFNELLTAMRQQNVNVSAGAMAEGRKDIRVRAVGQYDTLEQVRETVVIYDAEGGPVRVKDLAEVVLTLEKRRSFVRARGNPAMALNAIRETGANVIEVMTEFRERIAYANQHILPTIAPPGTTLTLEQVYDETVYIDDAILLVRNNLFIGGSLAMIVLLVFLRILRPTLIVALAIPVSVVGTFVVMTAAGRNINVISLAGLAFAVGMVVDAAIVVLENIDRHLGMGKKPVNAAYDGSKEVWGAILASTLTTVAVFLPVIFMEEEAGQLFRDIALAICAAVLLSLLVSVTVIPTAAARWLRARDGSRKLSPTIVRLRGLFGLAAVLAGAGRRFADIMYTLTSRTKRGILARLGIVGGLTLLSVGLAYLLMPPTTYLPTGNRNLVFGIAQTPPGYNIDQNQYIGERVEARLRPYWEADTWAETKQLPPVMDPTKNEQVQPHPPPIENFFFVSFQSTVFMGGSSKEKTVVAPLAPLMMSASADVPDVRLFAFQPSIFGRGVGGTASIEVEVVGSDLAGVINTATVLEGRLRGLQKYQVRPDPANYNRPAPELRFEIDQILASEVGIDNRELGTGLSALVDGVTVGDYRHRGSAIDLVLVRDPATPLTRETLRDVPLTVIESDGERRTAQLSTIAHVRDADSPQQIRRIEEQRAVTLIVEVPATMPLEAGADEIMSVVADMRAADEVAPGVTITPSGSADSLVQVRQAMLGKWTGINVETLVSLISSRLFLALVITFLLMAALFESFLYPFVILFSVPLATVGGFLGLAIVHFFVPTQQLDVLTMLGFVILIGIVVNNAILIVHQALNFMRGVGEGEGDDTGHMQPREAIRASVRTRIRPIFMTTLTSTCGMLPLVLMPGSGSELYRGLGSVIVGGLLVSTIFTLVVVPLLFSLTLDAKLMIYRKLGWPINELGEGDKLAQPR